MNRESEERLVGRAPGLWGRLSGIRSNFGAPPARGSSKFTCPLTFCQGEVGCGREDIRPQAVLPAAGGPTHLTPDAKPDAAGPASGAFECRWPAGN